jgi:hypothetical protein
MRLIAATVALSRGNRFSLGSDCFNTWRSPVDQAGGFTPLQWTIRSLAVTFTVSANQIFGVAPFIRSHA